MWFGLLVVLLFLSVLMNVFQYIANWRLSSLLDESQRQCKAYELRIRNK